MAICPEDFPIEINVDFYKALTRDTRSINVKSTSIYRKSLCYRKKKEKKKSLFIKRKASSDQRGYVLLCLKKNKNKQHILSHLLSAIYYQSWTVWHKSRCVKITY